MNEVYLGLALGAVACICLAAGYIYGRYSMRKQIEQTPPMDPPVPADAQEVAKLLTRAREHWHRADTD